MTCRFATTATASRSENGLARKRPIMAGACLTCVWGPLAVLTKQALAPRGYDVQICYNCNRQQIGKRTGEEAADHGRRLPHLRLGSASGVDQTSAGAPRL